MGVPRTVAGEASSLCRGGCDRGNIEQAGKAPVTFLPEVCGHVRGFAPAELRLVLAAFAGHGQALWLRPNKDDGYEDMPEAAVTLQDLVLQLLVGGSRLGNPQQLLETGEAVSMHAPCTSRLASEFWVVFAERVTRLAGSESLEGQQMAWVFSTCARWTRRCSAVVSPSWGHMIRTIGGRLAEPENLSKLELPEVVALAKDAAHLGEPQPRLAAAVGRRVGLPESRGRDRGMHDLSPQDLIDLIGAAGSLGGRLHMMTRAFSNQLEPRMPELPTSSLAQLCSHLGALNMFPQHLAATLENVLAERLNQEPLEASSALKLLRAFGRLRWRAPGVLGPVLACLKKPASMDALGGAALGSLLYELYRLDIWDEAAASAVCQRLRGPPLDSDLGDPRNDALHMVSSLPCKTAANVLLAMSYFAVPDKDLHRRLVQELLRAKDLPQEAMYQVKTFEMAIRLGHAAVSLQDLGGLAARWLFSVRGAAGAPELRGESAFADEVSQVARNISWHHRAEVEVGPYMLDFAAVSTDGHDQENPPDGWDENKPGRSLARYCVAVEADGPTHFYRPHGKPWHWTSTSKLRHRLLSAMRIRVAHVPFFDWLQLEGLAQKEAYLTELLLKVHSSPFPSLKLEAPAGLLVRRKLALGSDVQAAPPLLVQSIDTDLTDLPSSTEAPSGALAETQRVKEKHSETNPDYKYCADEEVPCPKQEGDGPAVPLAAQESKEKLSPHQPDLTVPSDLQSFFAVVPGPRNSLTSTAPLFVSGSTAGSTYNANISSTWVRPALSPKPACPAKPSSGPPQDSRQHSSAQPSSAQPQPGAAQPAASVRLPEAKSKSKALPGSTAVRWSPTSSAPPPPPRLPPPPPPPLPPPPPPPARKYVLDALNILNYRNEAGDGPLEWDLLDLASNHFKRRGHDIYIFCPKLSRSQSNADAMSSLHRRFGSKSVVTTPSGKDDDSFMLSFAKLMCEKGIEARIVTNDRFRDFIQQGVVTESEADKLTVKYCFAAGYFVPEDEYGTRRTCAEPAEPPNASAVGAERTRGSYIRRKVTMRKHYDDRLPVQHQGPPGRGRLFSEAFQWIDTWLDELKGSCWYLVLAFLPQSPGLESLDACPSGTAECYARVTDDPYEEDLFLLQHSAAVREADEINASKAALQTLSPEPGSTEAGPLVRLLHLISSIRHRAAARWGWGSSDPKPPTPEEACTSGLFFKYSDVKLEENLEATFSLHSHGADCSSKSAFGPNECCLQFGTDIGVTIQAVLPQNLTQNAVMHTRVSAWYGWIPLWDSMSCKICGEPCRACPSISQYLPSLFPCEPTPMPDCPIPAGSVTNSANVTLPLDVQQKAKGSKDLIKKEASAQDSRRPEAQRVREAETKQKRVDEHMRSCETWTLSRTYIGFTMDPRRRLRQHNGEIKGVDKNVRVLLEMLQAIPYNRIPLRVHFLEESLWTGLENLFGAALPNHLTLTHGSFDDLQGLCKQRLTMVMPPAGSECVKCSELLKPGDLVVHCPHCECLMHLSCAATVFTGTSKKLMPDDPADCLKCSVSMDWLVLLRNQRVLRSAAADECEEENEEEEDDDGNYAEDHGDDDGDGDDDGSDDDEEREPKVSIGSSEAEVTKVLFRRGDSDMQAFEPSSSQMDRVDSSLPSLSSSPPGKSQKQTPVDRRRGKRAALPRCDGDGGDREPSEVGSFNDQKTQRTPLKKARTRTPPGAAVCADAAASSSGTASATNSPKVDRCDAYASSKLAGASASLRQRLAQRTGDGSAFSI
ncbi:Structure-specific endonuclease subunit SLX1-like [Symbiodinium microadriaticum]|uniref:Structure-specific endonuclease subunit SLX1-like n=1 Tax=Symbiodinium microadriaticum TaxID=2951 RepID=A0A1Q9DS54_SYMMI|nr:Structure-specific endonuclease subunit SLX1-like [Symbiodinium microadriaticum]